MTTAVPIAGDVVSAENADTWPDNDILLRMFQYVFQPSTVRHIDDDPSESDSDTDDDNLPDQFVDVVGTVTGPYIVDEYARWTARVEATENPDPTCTKASRNLAWFQNLLSVHTKIRDMIAISDTSSDAPDDVELGAIDDDQSHEPYAEAYDAEAGAAYEMGSRQVTGEIADGEAFALPA